MREGRVLLHIFNKGVQVLFTEGFVPAWRKTSTFLFRSLGAKIEEHGRLRSDLGERLAKQFGDRLVLYGVFEGMRLSQDSGWGKSDLASQLLGLYEKEVVRLLASLARKRQSKTLVNVGAAEGYFAIGALHSGLFSRTVAFEMSENSRRILLENASLNAVETQLTVFGRATAGFLDEIEHLDGFSYEGSIFLVDTEGAELDFIDEGSLQKMARATLIIETHTSFVSGKAQSAFESLCSRYHSVSEIRTEGRNPGDFPELDSWSDDERWAIGSEGRPQRGRWLILEPLEGSSQGAAVEDASLLGKK